MDRTTAKPKASEILRAAAKRAQKYGFDERFGKTPASCGCFLHHIYEAQAALGTLAKNWMPGREATNTLKDVINTHGFDEGSLRTAGWDRKAKRDAVAALNIAADIAEASGR